MHADTKKLKSAYRRFVREMSQQGRGRVPFKVWVRSLTRQPGSFYGTEALTWLQRQGHVPTPLDPQRLHPMYARTFLSDWKVMHPDSVPEESVRVIQAQIATMTEGKLTKGMW